MTLWACLCAGDILISNRQGGFTMPVGNEAPVPLQPWNLVTTIELDGAMQPGLAPAADNRRACAAAAVPPSQLKVVRLDRPVVGIEGLEMHSLRSTFGLLAPQEYVLAGKAAELIYWDSNTKYCGCCGAPMRLHTSISKRCTNCGKEVWPQLATAVIVRITRRLPSAAGDIARRGGAEAILLVRANNFRGNHYGLVAGFVETGETLEEAVRREVREETGLEIANLRYFGSQPWPYPCGLMVGFTADYASGEIRLQRAELATGDWFMPDNMPPIPDKAGIARALIDDWLGGQAVELCRD